MKSREERAKERRATWKGSLRRDGEHAPMPLMTAEQALGVMWQLAQEAWTLAGRELPTYTRADMPGRIVRGLP